MSDNLDPEIRSLIWFKTQGLATANASAALPAGLQHFLVRLWHVCHSEADMIFQESFLRVETHMTANWIEDVLILNFDSSTFLKNKLWKTFESLPLKGCWLPFLQLRIKEQRWPDANWLRSCQPQWTLLEYRESHLRDQWIRLAKEGLHYQMYQEKKAVDGHPSSCTTWDSSNLIDYRIFMWSHAGVWNCPSTVCL